MDRQKAKLITDASQSREDTRGREVVLDREIIGDKVADRVSGNSEDSATIQRQKLASAYRKWH